VCAGGESLAAFGPGEPPEAELRIFYRVRSGLLRDIPIIGGMSVKDKEL